MLASYTENILNGIESGYFAYIAHPDVVNFTEDDEVYEKYLSKICIRAKELDIPLEINFLGLAEDRRYPSERFFKLAAKYGNKVIYGVDAHTPGFFNDKDTFAKAEKFRESLGLKLTDEIKTISGR